MNFNIGPFPKYERPVQIGHFSTDSVNMYCDDNRQMKYLSLPKNLKNLHLNLNEGFPNYIGVYKDEEKPYNKILRWIISHKEEIGNLITEKDSRREIDFICHRSVLIAIISTLYEKAQNVPHFTKSTFRKGWLIHATKFGSVIYLCKIEEQEEEDDEQRRMTSWGHKFEQYITSDSIESKPDTSRPANVNEKFYVVMKSKLENLGLLFIGETDAVDPQYLKDHPNDSKSMDRFVEIKSMNPVKKNFFYRFKLLKWYLQSYLAGISKLICGFRNDSGIIEEVKVYDVSELPKMAEDHYWNEKTQQEEKGQKDKKGELKIKNRRFQSGRRPAPYVKPKAGKTFSTPKASTSADEAETYGSLWERAQKGLWCHDASLNFGYRFLNHVKQCVVKDDPKVVYKFNWELGSTVITCEELSPEHQFLPEWYIKEIAAL